MHDRIRLFPFRSSDGESAAVRAFAKTAAVRIDPGFAPSDAVFSQQHELRPYDYDRTTTRYGNDTAGVEVDRRLECVEMGAATLSADIIRVSAYGLLPGCTLAIESVRSANCPSFLRSLTLEVEGPSDAVAFVLASFRATFTPASLSEEELDVTLRIARGYLRDPMWPTAIEHAEVVLRRRPNDLDATMVLGIAWAALDRPDDARRALETVTALDPHNVDALYNVACLHLAGERTEDAHRCLRAAADHDPGNHPVRYMLGQALEKLGRTEDAIAEYRRALATSPNPGQAFHFSGLDFTERARDAIARLTPPP